ncbi:uncharacterized protein [Henckelia pumila]|uniref:uncharacterized protein n=1 Tax=Henckelia pumila TaxID=405737 RepID=UPI003C6E9895
MVNRSIRIIELQDMAKLPELLEDAREIELVAAVMWNIWLNRNNVIWNGICSSATHVYRSALDLLSQWKKAHSQLNLNHGANQSIGACIWQRPPEHVLKCNVDATLLPDPPLVGFGCLVRDSYGIVLAAIHGRVHGSNDPALAEALAIREALSWIKDLHFPSIIVESDALTITDALNNSILDCSALNLIIEDCKLLARDVSSCTFVFARRSAN